MGYVFRQQVSRRMRHAACAALGIALAFPAPAAHAASVHRPTASAIEIGRSVV